MGVVNVNGNVWCCGLHWQGTSKRRQQTSQGQPTPILKMDAPDFHEQPPNQFLSHGSNSSNAET